MKKELHTAFALDPFTVWKQFAACHLQPGETVNVFLAELHRLAILFRGMSEEDLQRVWSLSWQFYKTKKGRCLHAKIKGVATARSRSCSAGPVLGLSASTHQEVPVAIPDSRDQGVEVLSHPLGIWA